MKALVYHGPGQKAWEEVRDPVLIDPTDVIVQIDTTTICGTDLHILKGDVPAVTDGRILGHEGVGTIVEIGSGVSSVAIGDRVIISSVRAAPAPTATKASTHTGWPTRVPAASAGSSVTSSTAPRPSTCAFRSPTTRSTRCPTGSATMRR